MSENGEYTEVSNSDESEGVLSLDWDGLTVLPKGAISHSILRIRIDVMICDIPNALDDKGSTYSAFL
jgi:hypothetical protein